MLLAIHDTHASALQCSQWMDHGSLQHGVRTVDNDILIAVDPTMTAGDILVLFIIKLDGIHLLNYASV